jgi:Zn-dependent peptidase ImmA (M78 family)
VVQRLARALDFPIDFFFDPEVDIPVEGSASFRSMTAMSARERDAALAAGALSFLVSDWVDRRFDLPIPNLLDLSDEKPEIAARSLRENWGLGEQPIRNMVHLLESKGVRVFSLAENTQAVDAFSLWRGDTPYIFLNTVKTAEHNRLDAAHELGHLILHKHGGPKGRRAEEQANLFGSSFLMPDESVLSEIPRIHTINQVIEAKKIWSVSVMALIHRLNKLKIMSDWQYRMFCIDATERGYRTTEPFSIARETSVVWQKVLTTLWNERVTKADIALGLHIPPDEIENLLFGLTGNAAEPVSVRPPLRLV